MGSSLINCFPDQVLRVSKKKINCHANCPKTPGYHQLHAGHGAPGSSCSIYTSCHRCHRSNGSYLQMNIWRERDQNCLERQWTLLALSNSILQMVESKTANSVDYNLIIFNNNKTLLWCTVYTTERTEQDREGNTRLKLNLGGTTFGYKVFQWLSTLNLQKCISLCHKKRSREDRVPFQSFYIEK